MRNVVGPLVGRLPVPVLGGPNRGRLWTLASAGRGYVSGRFEMDRVASILRVLQPGQRFWDIGAHKGYLTLAAAGRVGRDGAVLAVEPSSENLGHLRRHLRWNRVANVDVLPVAIDAEETTARFGGTGSSIAYRLGGDDETVTVRTIAGLLDDGRPPPDVAKIDVEGSEAAVLEGAGPALDRIGVLFVAVHDRAQHDACRAVLEGHGFGIVAAALLRDCLDGRTPWKEDPDLVAYRPGRLLTRPEAERLPTVIR